MKREALFLSVALTLTCCHAGQNDSETEELTPHQTELIEQGWTLQEPAGGELDESMGVKPIHGWQDNYFDISVGDGVNVALKIVDYATDRCIRYIYAPQNETVTVNEIPQGKYYIKLAYGLDWMTYRTDSGTLGKFTRKTSYKKSHVFDFGIKNSRQTANYKLEINLIGGSAENNFPTTEIDESEFERN